MASKSDAAGVGYRECIPGEVGSRVTDPGAPYEWLDDRELAWE